MSALCFELDVKRQYEARVPLFDTEYSIRRVYNVDFHSCLGIGLLSNSETIASNRQNTSNPKYNNDIS